MQRKNREREEKTHTFFLATLFRVLPSLCSKFKMPNGFKLYLHTQVALAPWAGLMAATKSFLSLSRYQRSSLFPRAVGVLLCTHIYSLKHNKNNARIKSNHEWSNSSDIARSRRVRGERENNGGDEEEQKRERRDDYSSSASFEKKQKSSFRFEEYGEDDYRGNVHGKRLDGE